ncbi:MAG: hypothetical protein ACKPKO_38720 [Candidatus Fonsibacter sp.]
MFSPSIEVDSTWLHVKEYIENHIELDKDEKYTLITTMQKPLYLY